MEAEAREHAARDAQPVRSACRRASRHRAGHALDCCRRRRFRRSVWDRRRGGPADLASPLRQHADESGWNGRHALPRWSNCRADNGRNITGHVYGVRRFLGWSSAAGQPRGRPGRRTG